VLEQCQFAGNRPERHRTGLLETNDLGHVDRILDDELDLALKVLQRRMRRRPVALLESTPGFRRAGNFIGNEGDRIGRAALEHLFKGGRQPSPAFAFIGKHVEELLSDQIRARSHDGILVGSVDGHVTQV